MPLFGIPTKRCCLKRVFWNLNNRPTVRSGGTAPSRLNACPQCYAITGKMRVNTFIGLANQLCDRGRCTPSPINVRLLPIHRSFPLHYNVILSGFCSFFITVFRRTVFLPMFGLNPKTGTRLYTFRWSVKTILFKSSRDRGIRIKYIPSTLGHSTGRTTLSPWCIKVLNNMFSRRFKRFGYKNIFRVENRFLCNKTPPPPHTHRSRGYGTFLVVFPLAQ